MTIAVLVILGLAGAAFAGFALLLLRADRAIKARPAQLAALACPLCNVLIGIDAAKLIAERRQQQLRCLHDDARRKGVRLRVSPYWRFPCPACGAPLKFDPDALDRKLTSDDATSRTSARPEPP